ncbi:MAG: sterol desaturase family protein, partial [Gammaproteobacteria bacterium]|nr:sterol desaturase family protein [Gammaproteobacteria bacterium]
MFEFTANGALLRLGCFVLILALMITWEFLAPLRQRRLRRGARWPHNLALTVVNTLCLKLLVPFAAMEAAVFAAAREQGLLNLVDIGIVPAVVVTVLVFDFAIYVQHRVFHAVPLLWRLHRVHHTDRDLDTTTAVRFHPVEIVLSMLIKVALVLALGAPAAGVLLFEIILNGSALFNHGDVAIPEPLDRRIKRLIVTPSMHQVHHSVHAIDHSSNFGFFFSVWDRLLGTYRSNSDDAQADMRFGIT